MRRFRATGPTLQQIRTRPDLSLPCDAEVQSAKWADHPNHWRRFGERGRLDRIRRRLADGIFRPIQITLWVNPGAHRS